MRYRIGLLCVFAIIMALVPAEANVALPQVGILIDEIGITRMVNRAFVDATLLGDIEAIPAQGAGVRIRVLGIYCQSALAVTLKFKSAGANIISAGFAVATNGSLSIPYNPHGWMQTNANEALNVNQSVAVNTGCQIVWIKAA